MPEIGFGAATSLAYLFGIAGQYVGGVLADRHDLRRLYLAFHALSLPALLLMTALSGLPLVGGAALFVFFSLGMQPIENSLFAHYTPARWRATAYGLKFVLHLRRRLAGGVAGALGRCGRRAVVRAALPGRGRRAGDRGGGGAGARRPRQPRPRVRRRAGAAARRRRPAARRAGGPAPWRLRRAAPAGP